MTMNFYTVHFPAQDRADEIIVLSVAPKLDDILKITNPIDDNLEYWVIDNIVDTHLTVKE